MYVLCSDRHRAMCNTKLHVEIAGMKLVLGMAGKGIDHVDPRRRGGNTFREGCWDGAEIM